MPYRAYFLLHDLDWRPGCWLGDLLSIRHRQRMRSCETALGDLDIRWSSPDGVSPLIGSAASSYESSSGEETRNIRTLVVLVHACNPILGFHVEAVVQTKYIIESWNGCAVNPWLALLSEHVLMPDCTYFLLHELDWGP
jgi:hypothetical protein